MLPTNSDAHDSSNICYETTAVPREPVSWHSLEETIALQFIQSCTAHNPNKNFLICSQMQNLGNNVPRLSLLQGCQLDSPAVGLDCGGNGVGRVAVAGGGSFPWRPHVWLHWPIYHQVSHPPNNRYNRL